MTAKLRKFWIASLTIAGALGVSATGASAQAIYADPYVARYPVAPGAYVAPAPIIAPAPIVASAPIVRERTVVVGRPAYVRAPVNGVPVPRYDYAAGYDNVGYDYATNVVVPAWW